MIAISATNPCHLYDLAREIFRLGLLGKYYSGYPEWRLCPPDDFPVETFSWRTVAVYGALKFLPPTLRPEDRQLFLWQDRAFDAAVARSLKSAQFIHAMPGQCRETFQAARRLGITTVLNHASGPVSRQRSILAEEMRRLGLPVPSFAEAESAELQEKEEYALADRHCVASRIVQQQLVEEGVAPEKIWVVPYGADTSIFHSIPDAGSSRFRIVFAGQVTVRKGVHHLFEALGLPEAAEWTLDIFGRVSPPMKELLAREHVFAPVQWHGAVSRRKLAHAFQMSSVLVLPSLEEGFGLVVSQALACGLPCIVSDRTGAADLITHRVNGSIVPVGNASALREELVYWSRHPRRVSGCPSWAACARRLAALSDIPQPAFAS